VAAWRRVHDIFQQEGADNARWVWTVSQGGTATPLAELYPGDAYVDQVGMDAYNWGTNVKPSGQQSSWRELSQVFGPTYQKLLGVTMSKPMVISETASSEQGGDKAAWIRRGMLTDVPNLFPRVQAVTWFNRDPSGGGLLDWRLNSSLGSLAAFREVAADPLYGGRLP
jgi:beta-mannanase